MRMRLLAAGIATAALFPSFAFAETTCEQQHSDRVVGTVAGGALGAVAGSAIAGHGNRTTGAVIGAIGGAVVGNQLTRGTADCAHAYGYYDNRGAWHANNVDRTAAAGDYDRDGQWVNGAPNGYYDSNNHWMAGNADAADSGYYDAKGVWVPASANGYYDRDGRWVAGAASGHYENGRWMAGPANGNYDSNGRWMAGAANGHRDANGVWIADQQPGYYDNNGRWRAGATRGYYDSRGRWISTSDRMADDHPRLGQGDHWNDAPRDVRTRVNWLRDRITRGQEDGTLSRYDARRSLRTLQMISQRESRMRHYRGQLGQRDEAALQSQLDRLSADVRSQMRS